MIDPATLYAVEVLGLGLVGFWLMWEGLPFAWGTLLWLLGRSTRK